MPLRQPWAHGLAVRAQGLHPASSCLSASGPLLSCLAGMLFATQRGFQGIISVCSTDCGRASPARLSRASRVPLPYCHLLLLSKPPRRQLLKSTVSSVSSLACHHLSSPVPGLSLCQVCLSVCLSVFHSECVSLWPPSPSSPQRQDGTSLLTHFLGKRLFDPSPLLSGPLTSLPGLGPQPHWGGRLRAPSLALRCAHRAAGVPCGESAGLGLLEAAPASLSAFEPQSLISLI